ncbi:MAG: hypothetical protein PCFJNLEI_00339 [Verrucomicrobiae bacterium]|nr:hypothetical protein [Verrucomicrobiae bacterium]
MRSGYTLAALLVGASSLWAAPTGQQLYTQHCAACHGPHGAGDGPAARYVYPKPRDFTRGTFKVRSTPDGVLPTTDDLLTTITRGMPGSAMPSFAYLSELDRQALVAHVQSLVKRPAEAPPTPIAVGDAPPVTPASIATGKQLYAKMQCFKCHGETGKGDGPSAAALKDSWDYPIKVRDFTTGIYLGGPTDRDLYLRFTTGMSGTPMPSYQEQLTDEQRWQLVHYVQSLRVPHEEFIPPKDNLIIAHRGTIESALDNQIPVMALWPCPHPLVGVHVRVAHDGKQLTIALEWESPAPSHAAVGQQQFRDGAAIQFSLTGAYTFLGMGDKDNPVNVWHWKSDWQGARTDVDTAPSNLRVDMYPRTEPIFITARAAGNLIAAETHKSPVEDLNAIGFSSLTSQPAAQQNVAGKGVWKDGKWRVEFMRDLTSPDAGDQQFKLGETIPISFAVWAGEHGDRNGQKAVSTWFKLKLEK